MSARSVEGTVDVKYHDRVSVYAAMPDVVKLTIDEDVAMDVAPEDGGGRKVYVMMSHEQATKIAALLLQAVAEVTE